MQIDTSAPLCRTCRYFTKEGTLSVIGACQRWNLQVPERITDMRHPDGLCGPTARKYVPKPGYDRDGNRIIAWHGQ